MMLLSVQVSVPQTSAGVLAVNLPCSEYKVVERGMSNQGVVPTAGGDKSDVLNGEETTVHSAVYTTLCMIAFGSVSI